MKTQAFSSFSLGGLMVSRTGVKGKDRLAHTHRIAEWDPEDAAAWAAGNHRIARRNLIWSIVTVHVAFSIWYLWSVMVLFMPQSVYGFTPSDKLLVCSTAALVGALVRIPNAMATIRFGARNWAMLSLLVLLIPTVGTIVLLANPGLPLWPYLVCAALTGLGGGNYAASMANAEALYPQKLKGWALGWTGGIANLGSASIQAVGLVVLATVGHRAPYAVCAIYVVLLGVAGLGAALFMDNFPKAIPRTYLRSALVLPDTWAISVLYTVAAGTFLGFAFAFGQVLQHNFVLGGQSNGQASLHAAEVAFIGPLLGSAARIAGGELSDRLGGGRVTLGSFAAAIAAGGFLVAVSAHDDLTYRTGGPVATVTTVGYIVGFIALFVFCGAAKGSVFKLIPSVFEARSRMLNGTVAERRRWERVMSGSVIGFAGALGGLGAMATDLALRQSYLMTGTETPAFLAFLASYIGAAVLTWARYLRPHARTPS